MRFLDVSGGFVPAAGISRDVSEEQQHSLQHRVIPTPHRACHFMEPPGGLVVLEPEHRHQGIGECGAGPAPLSGAALDLEGAVPVLLRQTFFAPRHGRRVDAECPSQQLGVEDLLRQCDSALRRVGIRARVREMRVGELCQDERLQLELVAGLNLGQRALVVRSGGGRSSGREHGPAELELDFRLFATGRCVFEMLLEQGLGVGRISGCERETRTVEPTLVQGVRAGGRRELHRQLREPNAGIRRSSGDRACGRGLHEDCDRCVLSVRGFGELTRALFGVGYDFGESFVDRFPIRRPGVLVDARRKQRMCEADRFPSVFEDPGRDGLRDRRFPVADHGLDGGECRTRKCRGRECRLARGWRQLVEPTLDDVP